MQKTPTPEKLIDANGQPTWGRFGESVSHINGREADYRTTLGKPASHFARHFHYKQFQYFCVISDELLIGCAFANTAWLGLSFVYIYDTKSKALHEYTWRSPLARALTLSKSPTEGRSEFKHPDVSIVMGYQPNANGGLEKTLLIENAQISLQASMREANTYQPMSLCTRTGINGWTYANKVAGVALTGNLQWQGNSYSLEALNASGHHDFSAGYMRPETFWNWACLSGTVDGHAVGFNLSCGVNETSETENCIWLDGELIKVNTVEFRYNRDDLTQRWHILSADGQVDIFFTPEGNHQEKLNLGIFATNFNQLFGCFNGTLSLSSGKVLTLNSHYGFVEEQFAKW